MSESVLKYNCEMCGQEVDGKQIQCNKCGFREEG